MGQQKLKIKEEIKYLFPDISTEWIIIYDDVEKMVSSDNQMINFKAIVVSGLCRILGEYIKNKLSQDGEVLAAFKSLGGDVWGGKLSKISKRTALYLPNDPHDAKKLWADWNRKVKELIIEIKNVSPSIYVCLDTENLYESDGYYQNNFKSNDLENIKNQLVDKLDCYSDSLSMFYSDIYLLLCGDVNYSKLTISKSVGSLIRQLSGALLNLSQFLIGLGESIENDNPNAQDLKKRNLYEFLSCDQSIIDEVFNCFSYFSHSNIDLRMNDINISHFYNYSLNLVRFLDAMDEYYLTFISEIDKLAGKNEFTRKDVKHLSNLTMSKSLIKRFLEKCTSPSAYEQLYQLNFFRNPYLKTHNKPNYLFQDIFPHSVALKQRANSEPGAILAIIKSWPSNIDRRVRNDCFKALIAMPNAYAVCALPKVNEWCDHMQHVDHEIDDFIDYFKKIESDVPNEHKKLYFCVIKKLYKALVTANLPKEDVFFFGTMSPLIFDVEIYDITLFAYDVLGDSFIWWFIDFYIDSWKKVSSKFKEDYQFFFAWKLWIPTIALPPLDGKDHHSRKILFALTDTVALVLKKYLKNGYAASRLKIFKNKSHPALRRLSYFFITDHINSSENITPSQKRVINDLMFNRADFFNLGISSEYGEALLTSWNFLDTTTQSSIWSWWEIPPDSDGLPLGEKLLLLRKNKSILPQCFQEELERLEVNSQDYNLQAQTSVELHSELGITPIHEMLNEIKKEFICLLGNADTYFNNSKKSYLLSTLSGDVRSRPAEYLSKMELWISFPRELSSQILDELHNLDLDYDSREWRLFLHSICNSSLLITKEIFYRVVEVLKKSVGYYSSNQNAEKYLLVLQAAEKLYGQALGYHSNLHRKNPHDLLHYATNSFTGITLRLILITLAKLYQKDPSSEYLKHSVRWISVALTNRVPDTALYVSIGEEISFLLKLDSLLFEDLINFISDKNNEEEQIAIWVGLAQHYWRIEQGFIYRLIPCLSRAFDLIMQQVNDKGEEWQEILERLGIMLVRYNLFYDIAVPPGTVEHFWAISPFFVRCRVIEHVSRTMGNIQITDQTNIKLYESYKKKYIDLLEQRIFLNQQEELIDCFWFYDNSDLLDEKLIKILKQLFADSIQVEPIWNVVKFVKDCLLKFPTDGVELLYSALNIYDADKLTSYKEEIKSCVERIKQTNSSTPMINKTRSLVIQKLGADLFEDLPQ